MNINRDGTSIAHVRGTVRFEGPSRLGNSTGTGDCRT
jgi:hypothetical protein